ncbi:MAG: DUF1653 domain-containing protein [Sideroxydans sp.]|nr:DUF1653 domain-containing protein [Sideroxydans sp.]
MHYQHYKGGIYQIVCEAKLESDPSVNLIIYRAANGTTWARPSEVFHATLVVDGKTVLRFTPINETCP